MAKILLNRNSDDAAISLEDDLILRVYTSNSLTHVEYLSEEDGRKRAVDVKETLAQVGGTSQNLVATTMLNTTPVWLNKERVTNVHTIDSKAVLLFDSNGAGLQRIELGATEAAWKDAVITKAGDFSYRTDSFTASPNTVVLDSSHGDVTAKFTSGVLFTVFGEGDDNDAIYTVVSSAWTTVTTITVTETPTANGTGTGYVWVQA